MNRKMLSMLAGAALFSGMGDAAYADEPMRLTDAQMDEVTAGQADLGLFLKEFFISLGTNVNFSELNATQADLLAAGIANLLAAAVVIDEPVL